MPTRRPLAQPVCFGKYLLLDKVGSGGMAEIYRAKTFGAHGFSKEYAIKKILPNLVHDEGFVSMFINEAKLAATLQHANIVQVLDLGDLDGAYFIAMEYVHGQDLHDLLARCAGRRLRIPLKLVLYIITEALKGLSHAHTAVDHKDNPLNIVHCDISPSNLLLSYGGDVKLGDFGVARAATQGISPFNALKGKVGYMSPEQVSGEPLDRRSDLFSCGIILYEMLALRRLFRGDNDLNIMLKIRDGDIENDLRALRPLPPSLGAILHRALSLDPDLRYQSAHDFHRDLMGFMFRHNIQVSGVHLSRFLKRVFENEYTLQNFQRRQDPDDPSAFPDLLSPEIARYRYRAPSGQIIGPMSRDTLVSLLQHRSTSDGSTVSVSNSPWLPPLDLPDVADLLAQVSYHDAEDTDPEELQHNHEDSIDLSPPEPAHSGPMMSAHSTHGNRVSAAPAAPETRVDAPATRGKAPPPPLSRPKRLPRDEPGGGPSPDALNGLPLSGSLRRTPFASLLYRVFRLKLDGVLRVQNGEVYKDIDFQQGTPNYVASNKPGELLGTFLCSTGVISQDDLSLALNRMSEFGGRLGDVLINEGILPSSELFHHLSLQIRDKLLDIFSWDDGSYVWFGPESSPPESWPLGVNPLEILIEGVRRHMSLPALRALMSSRLHAPLRLHVNQHLGLDGTVLTSAELTMALSIRDGSTPMDLLVELPEVLGVSEEQVLRVLTILYATQTIDFLPVPRDP